MSFKIGIYLYQVTTAATGAPKAVRLWHGQGRYSQIRQYGSSAGQDQERHGYDN